MEPPATPPRRSFLRRRLLDPIVTQLTQGITPEKIALTIAVGSALGVFPILGSTTLLCFLAGIALKLNQPIIQVINQLLWPVQIPGVFLFVRLGEWVFNAPHVSLSIPRMNQLFWNQPKLFFSEFGLAGVHAIVAWSIVVPFYLGMVYYTALLITREVARPKAGAATKESVQP